MFGKRISSLLGKITLLFVICFFALPAQAKYGGGSGTAEEPYLIYTAEQMNEIGLSVNVDDLDKHFKLMSNIDLGGYTGTSFNIIGTYGGYPFKGVFDGNGHTISNFTYSSPERGYIGLFGFINDPNAEIINLGLLDYNIDAGTRGYVVGSLVCWLRRGTISNCYVEGSGVLIRWESECIGGLVGRNEGTIINSYAKGNIKGHQHVGGLVGYNRYTGTITNCYSFSSVSGYDQVGGLVGGSGGTITNCYSTSSVVGDDEVGGLVGWNDSGTIANCSSTSSIVGDSQIGGLVGYNDNGTIINCYSTGSVLGNWSVGGLVGYNSWDTITNCSSTSSVAGNSVVGGLVGYNNRGDISSSYSIGYTSGINGVGGLVGRNDNSALITNCYSIGSVSGTTCVGGLVGSNLRSTIGNCYSTGNVLGDESVGGLVGCTNMGTVTSSFWDIESSGQATSAGGTGKTTAEMQASYTFLIWICDNEGIWTIDGGKDYPRLWWEDLPGEPITLPTYGGGNGEPNDPYLICTAEQLNTIGLVPCHFDKHFKLTENIDLTSFDGKEGRPVFNIIPFFGVFDGNGHTISNFTHTTTDTSCIGLFEVVLGSNAEIKNLGLISPVVDAGYGRNVGSLVSFLGGGKIANCYVKGGSVLGASCVGGLVGINIGTITNCYSTSSVMGDWDVGGLVGTNEGTITNCYSTGSVEGVENVGGLVGKKYGEVSASFWDIETSGQDWSAGGTGLATEQMQIMSTFTDAGWDFVGETVNGIEDIWFIPEGDYPHLWWEGMQVPMKLTPVSLNCRSEGNWIKAHITLPQGFTVEDVNSDRPAVLHSFGFQSAPLYIFVNKDKLVEIEAAFEREAVCSLVGDWPEEFTVTGFLADGNIFFGTSNIRIIHPGMKVIEELASCWLQEDCIYPETDMNRDSFVNLLDYALLMNISVEFVSNE